MRAFRFMSLRRRPEDAATLRAVAAPLGVRYRESVLWQEGLEPADDRGGRLPAAVDVLVVGAGYCGLSAAAVLAEVGRSVVVVDRERLGWGASTRNGGMVIPELK